MISKLCREQGWTQVNSSPYRLPNGTLIWGILLRRPKVNKKE